MQLARLLTVSAPIPSPSSRHAAWSPRKKRWFKLHMKKWGLFGTLVDVEKIKARKLHLVMYGCFGTEVDADIIEARKQALRDWWTPARRQAASERWTPEMRKEKSDAEKARWTPEMRQAASERWTPDMRKTASKREKARWTPEMRQTASDAWTPDMRQAASDAWTPEMRQEASERWTQEMRQAASDAWTPEMRQAASDAWTPEMRQTASDWWTDARRDDHSDFMAKWFSDEEEGAGRREAMGMSAYLAAAAKRGDPNPPAPICLPAGTHCPACGNALGNRVVINIEVQAAQGYVMSRILFACPHKTCGSRPYITDYTKRAAVLATIPDGEGGDALEKAIVERMVLAVDRFNCALAKKKGAASKPYLLPAIVTLGKVAAKKMAQRPRADDIVVAENGEEIFRGCLRCGGQKTWQWFKGPEGPRTLCSTCGTRFKKGLPFNKPQRV